MKRGTWGWAICAATLFPVVRKFLPPQYRGPLPNWVPNQAYHLHTLRAHQLNELRKAGYDGTPYSYICPPSFVDATKGPDSIEGFWTCKHLWCPFCWGRMVALDTYERMRRIDKEYFKTHLVAEVRAYEYIPAATGHTQTQELIKTAADRVCQRLKLVTTSPGKFKLTTVEPAVEGIRVTVRVIAFVTPQFALKHPPNTSSELNVEHQSLYGANYEFAKLVGRVCEYPFGLLFEPAKDVKRALELRDGLRLMANSGLFRQKGKSDESAPELEDQQPDVSEA